MTTGVQPAAGSPCPWPCRRIRRNNAGTPPQAVPRERVGRFGERSASWRGAVARKKSEHRWIRCGAERKAHPDRHGAPPWLIPDLGKRP
ncbi:hypothetical protein CLOM_g18669 [Closterium sp. NIES-68]|nr:hypothetical protein CLOM_g24117 [Closterium sp. NIES-68]GJP32440.1 hypothetical protein CLOM_g17064 [Closterium sp. NIES-68]GJP32793.1 hypothetical protein CLOM_g17388 [Closterium sp. NIES-68]GJP34222.1 hypothetical protein CLOM_g18669 [Closterium sp. NIES-68]GJP69454.1 hypothetical protein CLOP_g466 [Closterium sp. NIES-67]